jgi:pyridinium-3,5-biscarboxylic acid mononucleotide synthase
MRPEEVKDLLSAVQERTTTVDAALRKLQEVPVDDLGFARLDNHRELRQGLPEVIYAEGKTADQVGAIAERMLETTTAPVLATRVSPDKAGILHTRFPEAVHHERANLMVFRAVSPSTPPTGTITVVSAGTSDLPVAEESVLTAETFGAQVHHVADAGVAGLHRLLGEQHRLHDVDVVIAVAGMEGALASLVGGISSAPVIAVPTSVGYGASFKGLAALLAMLNACAAGVVVTNIDNGFGAAMFALRLLRKIHEE